MLEPRVEFEDERRARTLQGDPGGLGNARSDSQLGTAPLGSAELNDELEVGVISGRVAGGGQGFDLARDGPDDVDESRHGHASQVGSIGSRGYFDSQSAERTEVAGGFGVSHRGHAGMQVAAAGRGR